MGSVRIMPMSDSKHFPAFVLVLCGLPLLAGAAEATRDQEVGQYVVRTSLGSGELRRSIFPRFRTEPPAQGNTAPAQLRLPVELYSEIRNYEAAEADAVSSYERAYGRLVEAGDCRPVASGFREASFDCGPAKGVRTVAVGQDELGPYFSWESTAKDQIPDPTGFDAAQRALDALTDQLLTEATARHRNP